MNIRYLTQIALLSVAWLSGCTPTRVSDRVSISAPKEWQHAPADQSANAANLKVWWQGFKDPLLNELIDRALAANHDLRIATARVRETQAVVTIAESALYPSIDLFASGGREKRIDRIVGVPGEQGIELIAPTADAVSGGLTARWEIDLFGGRHLEAEAVAAQAGGSVEALHAAQVRLLAQVATNYLELRGVQERTRILQENIKLQGERLRTLQAFYRTGLAHEADIARQQTLLHSTEGALPALTNTASSLIHRLGVLLGEPPEHLENRLVHAGPLPKQLPSIPRLLPSSLLAQRPDLRLAQTEVSAVAASLGSARADLFPKLVLSANGGFGALAVGGFPGLAESIYALGAGLSAPIFNAGRIRAHIAEEDARFDQVAANYEKTFLLALEDVENAFVAHTTSQQSLDQLSQAEVSAERAYRLVDALYRHGVGDYLSVLDAERSKLAVNDERAKAETAAQVSMVSIYRAFGGGWAAEQSMGLINNESNTVQVDSFVPN